MDQIINNYVSLFEHPGWVQFMQETEAHFNSLNYDNCKDFEAFIAMRSAREQLARVLGFRQAVENHIEQLAEEANDDTV